MLALLAAALLAQPAVVGSSGVAVLGTDGGAATVLPLDAPRLYLDCLECDDVNYIRENVAFVVYVRDRADADVHVIVTWQLASNRGYEGTLRFLGLGRFAGMDDQLTVQVAADASPDDQRKELARALRVGLARYAARTRIGRELDVSWTPDAAPLPETDPWNRWVMSLAGRGSFTGESTYRSSLTNGSVTAARVTERWKIRAQTYVYFTETRFDLGDGVVVESFQRDSGASFFAGRGFGDHFAMGVRPSWSSSIYTNIRSQPAATGVVEWSVFPYSEATRRSVVFQAGPRVERPLYYEETIFEKEEETLFSESAQVTVDATQPWGSITGNLYAGHYFHDVSKAEYYATLSMSLRLVRGLSFSFSGSASLLRNQLYLPKAGATNEEILLRRQQLATQYTYSSSIGLTYTFGSIFTPVVNTRLAGY